MPPPNTGNWIRLGLLALPVYGPLTFLASLDPQENPSEDYQAWARFVTTNWYVLNHLLGSTLGLILAIFGVFALEAHLASGRVGSLGLLAKVITITGNALFLMLMGLYLRCARRGTSVLDGHRGVCPIGLRLRWHRTNGHLLGGHSAPLRGQRALECSRLALGNAAQVGGSHLGGPGPAVVPVGPCDRPNNYR